jgi:hypothetical protein
MLEVGSTLRTWRLTAPPSSEAICLAEPLDDHRVIYLDYEGPVSGGRGSVRRWDSGTYDRFVESNDSVQFQLAGTKLRGSCSLSKVSDGWNLRYSAEGSA